MSGAVAKTHQQLAGVQRELEKLLLEHEALHFEHSLLVNLNDSLHWIRKQQAGLSNDSLLAVNSEELHLLEQLRDVSYGPYPSANTNGSSHCTSSSAAAGATSSSQHPSDPRKQPMAPQDDSLYILRYLLSLPACPAATTMTADQLARRYDATVKEASLILSTMDSPCSSSRWYGSNALEALTHQLYSHAQVVVALTLRQRCDVVYSFTLTNLETGEQLSEYNAEMHRWAVQQLELSQQQQQRIAQGCSVFNRLLAPLLKERQQLQQEQQQWQTLQEFCRWDLGEQKQQPMRDANNQLNQQNQPQEQDYRQQQPPLPQQSAQAPAAAAASSSGTAPARPCGMEQAAALCTRLKKVLAKEAFLLTCNSAFITGCLTAIQCAKLMCVCWPFPFHLPAIGHAISELWRQQQQQQQQSEQQQLEQQHLRCHWMQYPAGQQQQQQQNRQQHDNHHQLLGGPANPHVGKGRGRRKDKGRRRRKSD